MGVEKILSALKQMKVILWVENNKVNYLCKDTLYTDDLKKLLSENEKEIIDFYYKHRVKRKNNEDFKGEIIENAKLIQLPFDYYRPPKQKSEYALKTFNFFERKSLSQNFNGQEFNDELILIAVTQILLYRYTGDSEISIGCLFSDTDEEKIFSNISVLHCKMSYELSFKQLLNILSEEIASLKSEGNNSINYNPLYQVAFSFNDFKDEPFNKLETNYFNSDSDSGIPLADIHISFAKTSEGIRGYIWYNSSLFKPDTIDRMCCHFSELLQGAIKSPDSKISVLPILSEAEKQVINTVWEDSNVVYEKLLHQIFEEQVEKTPDNIAVIYKKEKLTYKDLNAKINMLANKLIELGVGSEVPVAVLIERSSFAVICLMAVLKAGGVYVPIDRSYPVSHQKYILEQAEIDVIISQKDLTSKLPVENRKVICIDDRWDEIEKMSSLNPEKRANTDNSAVILYTSGSTGKPKGVVHGQGMLIYYLSWWWDNFPFDKEEILCQRTNINHIPSLQELLVGLLKGIPTVILPDEIVRDPFKLMDELAKSNVTRIRIVPSLLKMILDSGINIGASVPKLKLWYSLGEPLSFDLYTRFRNSAPNAIILNEFATTETNGVLYFDSRDHSDEMKSVPIGKIFADSGVFILDKNKEIAPIGVAGEIHVCGICVAKGYLNLPEITAERFIQNPFCSNTASKLYNTGDYAKYLANGSIEYIGRRDNQVKIRGVRIELTQIEVELSKHPGIKENAVCIIDNKSGGKKLASFIVLKDGVELSEAELKEYCERELPEYMVPSYIVKISKLPQTPNAKLDRTALPALLKEVQKSSVGKNSSKENNQKKLENSISVIKNKTAEILEISAELIDINKSFKDLGVDSVSAVNLVRLINKEFNCKMAVTSLYNYPSIAEFAESAIQFISRDNYEDNSKNKQNRSNELDNGSIAVIGMSGCFPEADNVMQFWENLIANRVSIGEIPSDRWEIDKYYDKDPRKENKTISKVAGFINNIDQFDNTFFNISRREAELMDPQQRLSLMECWKAFEDAGYSAQAISGSKTGVFIGVWNSDYSQRLDRAGINPDAYTMMGNDSSILAARISYFLNLKGPNIPINTACSSSLVAVHEACQSILAGECSMAVAGGATVITTQNCFITTSKSGMLTPEGGCKTFDNKADGIALGETVAFVVLKSLKEAVKDGDNIYGIVRSSGINQDGKTNGITAPSAISQSELELEVYKKADINPETITCVEAHGTGTKLGDPIEVEALTNAFRKYTNASQFCAIGSVKPNIGHTTAAAGIASMIKMLLALKHRKIPATLNFDTHNNYIDFINSPFYVNNTLQDWETSNALPRRAAVSSFGYSGTNAHLVLEEYIAENELETEGKILPYYLIPISAKTKNSLKGMISALSEHLRTNELEGFLQELAYTLQVGRTHFNTRCCFVVKNIADLKNKLTSALEGNLAEGHVAIELSENISNVESYNELLELAQAYVNGSDITWENLYDTKKAVRKLSLPTYCFDKESFWVDEVKISENKEARLHPLIQCNTSTIYEQKFSTYLTMTDRYVSGHIVNDENILPGAAIIEMIRAAGELAGQRTVEYISNISFMAPVVINEKGKNLDVGLSLENDKWTVKLTAANEYNINNRILYSKAEVNFKSENYVKNFAKLDVGTIIDRCGEVIEKDEVYAIYMNCGLNYGEDFRLVEKIYLNSHECISKIYMQDFAEEDNSKVALNPLLIDSVIHSAVAMLLPKDGTKSPPFIPYLLNEIKIFGKLEKEIFAYCKLINNDSSLQKTLDILIADKAGNVLVEMSELVLHKLNAIKHEEPPVRSLSIDKKIWCKAELNISRKAQEVENVLIFDTDNELALMLGQQYKTILVMPGENFLQLDERTFKICAGKKDDFDRLIDILANQSNLPHQIIYTWSKAEENYIYDKSNISKVLSLGIYSLTFLTQALLSQKIEGIVKLLYIYQECTSFTAPFDSAISGFVKTLYKENPNYIFKCIGLDEIKASQNLVRLAINEFNNESIDDFEIRYKISENERKVKALQTVEVTKNGILPIKKEGIYLITGGLGGVGMIFAEYFAKEYNATLILTGRSPLDEKTSLKLEKLKLSSNKIIYIQSDISDKAQVVELNESIKEKYGSINGVIHAAGQLKDSFIIKKNSNEIAEVLSSKIFGTLNLHKTFNSSNMDFLVLFSSVSAEEGLIGQADYAYANSFMDNFAQSCSNVISINWGLWNKGGMKMGGHNASQMSSKNGMLEISANEGITMFSSALMMKEASIVATVKDSNYTKKYGNTTHDLIKKTKSDSSDNQLNTGSDKVQELAWSYFAELISEETKMPLKEISLKEPFRTFGIDSIMSLNMVEKLEKSFGLLSKTLFYENQTIEELIAYFIKNYSDKLTELLMKNNNVTDTKIEDFNSVSQITGRFETKEVKEVQKVQEVQDIAIIGVSGRYPMAESLEELWENLKAGKDCIIEIPSDRWDGEKNYDPDKNKRGTVYSKWGGFVKDVDKFDPLFFKISPRDAEKMDPQQRLFLQTAWHTVEDAGYTKGELEKNKVGVFAGVMWGQYHFFGVEESLKGNNVSLNTLFAAIANRVSYALNLNGPSISLDTMCSSSSTAIHLACESLKRNECDLAIAGGVNLSLHPDKYQFLSQEKFSSSDGKCRSFGEGGDGYVPGEGVGCVLLKPLDKAVADRDNIYAVIKGTAINHGGMTSGFTVPNPKAQEKVILDAYEKAGVNPETISYIEAHGTGTQLGDPIEITGLSNAFNYRTQLKQFCPIGSIKSNIGHLESAAGVAGITKILLQMKYKELVPSLHSEVVNPYINFENSPFYIQRGLTPWKKPEGDYPRRAGISSFGAGGANAHIILEEYEKPIEAYGAPKGQMLFTLSAINKERLKTYGVTILNFISRESEENTDKIDLQDLEYTLHIGREQMEERLAFVFSDEEELLRKLFNYCSDDLQAEKLFLGNKNSNRLLFEGALGHELASNIVKSRELDKIAALWVSGIDIDWVEFHKDDKHNRISIPGYPFLKESYWVPAASDNDANSNKLLEAVKLHPLLDANISDFYEQKFSTKFTGKEYIFEQHIINGNKYLPGAAFIEIACIAMKLAGGRPIKQLKGITWIKPIIAGTEHVEVFTALYPESQPEFEFYTQQKKGRVTHAKGKAVYADTDSEQVSEKIDMGALKSRFKTAISGDDYYSVLNKHSMNYGAEFKSIKELWYSEEDALAYIELPQIHNKTFEDYILHPVLIDGVFQAAAAGIIKKADDVLLIPYAVEQIDISKSLKELCYAFVEACGNSLLADSEKLNIKVFDESGELLINIKGLSLKKVESSLNRDLEKTLYFTSRWEQTDLPESVSADKVEDNILIVDTDDSLYNSFKNSKEGQKSRVFFMQLGTALKTEQGDLYEVDALNKESFGEAIGIIKKKGITLQKVIYNGLSQKRIGLYVSDNQPLEKITPILLKNRITPVFYLTYGLIKNEISSIRVLFLSNQEDHLSSAIDGFSKSMRLEQPGYSFKSLRISGAANTSELIEKEMNCSDFTEIMYSKGSRFTRQVRLSNLSDAGFNLQNKGVYLITGGAGGLGLVFAEYLVNKAEVKVILIGRSELDETKRSKINDLKNKYKSEIHYIPTDISNKEEVKLLISNIRKEYGEISGLLHSAGAIRDSFVINKRESDIEQVINPKILGTVYLDEELKNVKLDFFILFSSITSVMGNMGQTDYAFANRFMDYYAQHREDLRQKSERYGKTISINWPLWDGVGMDVNDKARENLKQNLGLMPISVEDALKAFEACFSAGESQVIVANGVEERMKSALRASESDNYILYIENNYNESSEVSTENKEAVKKKLVMFLRDMLADELKIPSDRINSNDTFDKYGMDSIAVMNMNEILEKHIKNLPKSLYYEYVSIDELSKYFMTEHFEWANNQFGSKEKPVKIINETSINNNTITVKADKPRFIKEQTNMTEDIAIIGLSGKYPYAEDMEDFWKVIKEGRDCISEIPKERWRIHEYYSDNKGAEGKSYSKWGGFLRDVDKFDSLFFNISPHEAQLMDPQERIFLETAWHTFEDANYRISDLSDKKVGVFVGAMWGLYQLYGAQELLKGNHVYPNSTFASIANRVSYCFNLNGPSLALDTMCSSSITAIHLACESIRRGECEFALAGGVNVSIHPYKYLLLSDSSFISTDGKCRAFGKGGDGYVPGEGVGAVLLKPLTKAVEDGDNIYGVIKATSINHNGKTAGYTVPNPNAQSKLITESIKKAGIEPETISYIEAHGPGTSLGDPIEIAGLLNSVAKDIKTDWTCPVGSVKSNIGHLEAAAGIAGVTKVLMQMKNKHLVPSLHSQELNPNINFDGIPFYIQQKYEYWKKPVLAINGEEKEYPRRAFVSSFGAGGSNAHIIIEEYENHMKNEKTVSADSPHIIKLSARNSERLMIYANNLKNYIMRQYSDGTDNMHNEPQELKDIAYSLNVGRDEMEERLALVVSSKKELIEKLEQYCTGTANITDFYSGNTKSDANKYGFLLEMDEGTELIRKLMENRNLSMLGQLWVTGVQVKWDMLYPAKSHKRIALPGYPFERERHWIEIAPSIKSSSINLVEMEQKEQNESKEDLKKTVLKKIASLLKLGEEDISNDTEISTIGFSSIIILRMLNQINEQYGVKITPVDLKLSPFTTIGEIIGIISGSINQKVSLPINHGKDELIEDPDLSFNEKDMFPEIIDMSSSLKTQNIFLTGATGVLGGRLMKDILEATRSNVYCLVRAKDINQATKRLKELLKAYDPLLKLEDAFGKRVIPVLGDIVSDKLGMTDEDYIELAEKTDMVIHCAAKLSLIGLYEEVKDVNVKGTQNCIEFALKTEQKYLTFISTHGIMGDRWLEPCEPLTEKALVLGQGFENMGYQKSKFDAEIKVRLAGKKGLKWNIIRAGNIMGDSVTGTYPFDVTNVVGVYYDLFRTAIELKYAPDSRLYLDVTPVDYLSSGIIYLCTSRKTVFETYHVTNPHYTLWPEVYGLVRDYGYDISIIDNDEYLEIIKNQSETSEGNTSVIVELTRFNPMFRKSIIGSSYADNSYTTDILESAGIVCCKTDSDLIKTYIDYCIKIGYFKAPMEKKIEIL